MFHFFKLNVAQFFYRVASILLELRDSMWNVVRYLVQYQGLVDYSHETDYRKIENYKGQMLQVLVKMLNEAAVKIDEPEATSKRSSIYNEELEEE